MKISADHRTMSSIQLAAKGIQDEYFTGSPSTSFFKSIFIKHTEFILNTKEFPFHNSFFRFGTTQICSLNGAGDIIRSITLKMKLPPIFVPNFGYTYPEVPTPQSFVYLDSQFNVIDSYTTKMNTLYFTSQDLSWLPAPVSYIDEKFSFNQTVKGIQYIAFTTTQQALFWGFKNFVRFINNYYIFDFTGTSEVTLGLAGWINRYFPGIQTYTPNVAPKLLKWVELHIGGQCIERISGEYIIIYNDLFVPEHQQLSIQKLTGYTPIPATTYTEYYIKLPFSLQVPKCALFRNDIEVFVEYQPLDTVTDIKSPVNTSFPNTLSASAYGGYFVSGSNLYQYSNLIANLGTQVSNSSVTCSSNVYFLSDPNLIMYAPTSNTLTTFTHPGPQRGYKSMYCDGTYIYSFSATGSNVAWRFNTITASHEFCTLSQPFVYSGSINTDGLSNVMSVPTTPDSNIIRYDTTLPFTQAHSYTAYPLDTTRSGFDYTASVYANGSLVFGSKERFVSLASGSTNPKMESVDGLRAMTSNTSGVFYDNVSNVYILAKSSMLNGGEMFIYNLTTKELTSQTFPYATTFNSSVQISSNTVAFIPSTWFGNGPGDPIVYYSLDTHVFTEKVHVPKNNSVTSCLVNSNVYVLPYFNDFLHIYDTNTNTVSNIFTDWNYLQHSVYDGSQFIYAHATNGTSITRINTLSDAFGDISGHDIYYYIFFYTRSKSLKIDPYVYMVNENELIYFDLSFLYTPFSIIHNIGQVPLFTPFGASFAFSTDRLYLNSNSTPLYSQSTALTTYGSNVIIGTSNSIIVADNTCGDFNYNGYWSRGTFSSVQNKIAAVGNYFLTDDNRVYDINGNMWYVPLSDAGDIIIENSNVIALPTYTNYAYNIFDFSQVYSVPEMSPIGKYISGYLYSCSPNLPYLYRSTVANVTVHEVPGTQSFGHIEEYNSNVYFFPSYGNVITMYNSLSLATFDSNTRPEYTPIPNTISSLGPLLLSDSSILTLFVDGIPNVLSTLRGKDVQRTTLLPYSSMLDWYTQSQSSQQGVKSIYGALIGSGTLNVTSDATTFVYINGSLALSNSVYFKVQLFINGALIQTFQGFNLTNDFFKYVVQRGRYSVGFTTSTSSLLTATVFGTQGSDVITLSGLLSIGAPSDTATIVNGSTVSLTPTVPIGLTGYSYSTSNIIVFTESYANVSFSSNIWFTDYTSSSPCGSRYTQVDGMIFSTCPFIQKPSGNYYATQDNSLIVYKTGTTTQLIENTSNESLPLYSNIYSPSDNLLFFYSASDATRNLIGIVDFFTKKVTHVNVKAQCPTGQVYNLVYNAGVLYALSDGPKLVYLIGSQVFDISTLPDVPKILTSIVSVPVGDGVAFLPCTGSNIVCVNTTKSFYYQTAFPTTSNGNFFNIKDGTLFGSSTNQFYTELVFNGISTSPQTFPLEGPFMPPLSIYTFISNLLDIKSSWILTSTLVKNSLTTYSHTVTNPILSFPKTDWLSIESSTSNQVVFLPIGEDYQFLDQFVYYNISDYPSQYQAYRRIGSNVYMFPYVFNMANGQYTQWSNIAPDVLAIGPNLECAYQNSYAGIPFGDTEVFIELSSDGKSIITTGNVYQYDGQTLLLSPVQGMQVTSSNLMANASTWVSYSNVSAKNITSSPASIRSMKASASNILCVTDSNIICFSNSLEYSYTVVSGIQGPVRDVIFQTSNILILADGSLYTYDTALSRKPLATKFNTQLIQTQNDIYIASSIDIDLYRLSSNTSTVDRFIDPPNGTPGASFSLGSNVYTLLMDIYDNPFIMVYDSNSVPLYSQTFPYSIQSSYKLGSTIYYSCPPNIVAYDTTKPFWIMNSYSNIGPVGDISVFTSDGENTLYAISTDLFCIQAYDTVTSTLTTLPANLESSIPTFAVYDSKSIFMMPYGHLYTFSDSLVFPQFDVIPQVPVNYLSDLEFDGRYVYTLSNIVYAVDTTTSDVYQVLIQNTLPQFTTSVSSGYYDGQFLNICSGNVNTQIDLYPVSTSPLIEASIIANSAFISQQEKQWMNSGPLDYIVTHVQQTTIDQGYYMVNFLNPTKEFILTGPLESLKVFLNGNLLVDPSTRYMSNVSQLQYHSRRSTFQDTYCVSLSLGPEQTIPTGHINLSRIKEQVFASDTNGPVTLYALSHNIFRARDGIGGLVFNTNM